MPEQTLVIGRVVLILIQTEDAELSLVEEVLEQSLLIMRVALQQLAQALGTTVELIVMAVEGQ